MSCLSVPCRHLGLRLQLVCTKHLAVCAEAMGHNAEDPLAALALPLQSFLQHCLEHALKLAACSDATPPVGLVLASPVAILVQLLQCARSLYHNSAGSLASAAQHRSRPIPAHHLLLKIVGPPVFCVQVLLFSSILALTLQT